VPQFNGLGTLLAGTDLIAVVPDYTAATLTAAGGLRAEDLPFEANSFDAYTIAFGIRNVPRIDVALSEAHRVLKRGGRLLVLEFSEVDMPLLDRVYDSWSFNAIPKFGKAITGEAEPYQYLVESIRKFPNQENFAEMIRNAGFSRVIHRHRIHARVLYLGRSTVGPRHAVGVAFATLGGMLGGAALGIVDRLSREQRIALGGKALFIGQFQEALEQLIGQMRLRPVEADRPLNGRELGQPVGIGGENGLEIGLGKSRERCQCRAGHWEYPFVLPLVDTDAAPVDSCSS